MNLRKFTSILKAAALLTVLASVFFFACNRNGGREELKTVEVDFNQASDANAQSNKALQDKTLRVVVSAMISPKETYSYYEELFNYISERLDMKVIFNQRKTYEEANDLLLNNQVDLGFLCSGAYIRFTENDSMEILAVPVVNKKPFYQAYVITHNSLPVERFEQLRGRSFAFTDPMSNTGKLYAERRVQELGAMAEQFFSKIIFSYGHDISIQMVNKKLVDAATIDGLIYDYFAVVKPQEVANIKIIEKSEYYGIPPIVCPRKFPEAEKEKIRVVMYKMHEDSLGLAILDKLHIDKFIAGKDKDYNSIRRMYNLVHQ